MGNFLENDFWTAPPLLSILYMHLIFNTGTKWVMWPQRPAPQLVLASALGPLACSSRSVRPPSPSQPRAQRLVQKGKGPNPTLNMYTNLLYDFWGVQKSYTRTDPVISYRTISGPPSYQFYTYMHIMVISQRTIFGF